MEDREARTLRREFVEVTMPHVLTTCKTYNYRLAVRLKQHLLFGRVAIPHWQAMYYRYVRLLRGSAEKRR